jgi:hypothetical protein
MRGGAALLAGALLSFASVAHAATGPPAPAQKIAEPVQYGFVAGVLTIPFKFHLTDDTMTGGSTLGGYLGWKMSWMGLTLTPIVSTGMAMPTGNYGPGLTLAGGFIGSVAKTPMDWGIVLGVDWFSKASHYPYEGKPWLAVEIGYKFAR